MADIPNCPRGREEEYLSDIAGLTDNAPNNPWSRKEAYLAAIDGKMDNIEEQIAALSADISFKGSVPTADDLPETAAVGDAYITEDTGIIYVYVGESGTEPWVALGGSGGGSGAKTLTTADYNYPADNPDGVALWLLPPGLYCVENPSTTEVYIYTNRKNSSQEWGAHAFLLMREGPNSFYHLLTTKNDNDQFWWTGITTAGSQIGGSGYLAAKNNLTTSTAGWFLDASQGKVLNDKIEEMALTNSEFNNLWENA